MFPTLFFWFSETGSGETGRIPPAYAMHIGKRIKDKLKEDGHSVAWFAAQICCTRTHAYKIFNKENIDIEQLRRISRVLNHDFFSDLSESLRRDGR